MWLVGILAGAAFLRVWQIGALGYNSDEAVYGGQGASIAHDPELSPFFPAFRAHPLLFQTVLSLGYHLGVGEEFGRLASAAFGVATVLVVFMLGTELYGRRTGLVAAGLVALMPYHVVVTRQVLLDGPMVFFSTLTLYAVARFARTQHPRWLYAAAATMGLTFLSKESSIVLVGALYAFFALTPEVQVRLREMARALAVMSAIILVHPISLALAGKVETGGNYLAWQLFRRPNHDLWFYPSTVIPAVGILVVLAAVFGTWALRRHGSWRETLLLAWIAVPVVFLQIWPVKGFQYLLPVAPPIALLAARALMHAREWGLRPSPGGGASGPKRLLVPIAVSVVGVSLLVPSWNRIQPSQSASFLAGSGGVPGGREAGLWIRGHIPEGSRILTVGPSMANILQYYGKRKAYGLSVSPNPLNRNPSYEPLPNPDRLIRDNDLQYIVWDAFSAKRSSFFSRHITRYVDRYHGRAVHSQTVPARTADGRTVRKPVIVLYEVRP